MHCLFNRLLQTIHIHVIRELKKKRIVIDGLSFMLLTFQKYAKLGLHQ